MHKIKLLKILLCVNLVFCSIFFLAANSEVYDDTFTPLVVSDYITGYLNSSTEQSPEQLITLALNMSGIPSSKIAAYEREFETIIKDASKYLEDVTLESEGSLLYNQGEALLAWLHAEWLDSYSAKETRLDRLLDLGTFNCVSSAVFYLLVGTSLGLEITGVRTTDHAFCRISVEDRLYDVETTNLYGFNPGSKKEFLDEFGNITGFNYVSPGNYRKREEISPLKLVSLILQNRITYLSEAGEYEQAVQLAFDGWSLLKDQDSYSNMINAFLNRGSIYNKRGEYRKGIAFLDMVNTYTQGDNRLEDSRLDLLHNYFVTMANRKDPEPAIAYLYTRYNMGLLGEKEFRKYNILLLLKKAELCDSYEESLALIKGALVQYPKDRELLISKTNYIHNIIVRSFEGTALEDSYRLVTEYRDQGDLEEGRWRDYMVYIFQGQAKKYEKTDFLKAASIIQEGIKELGSEPRLMSHYNTYIYNYEVNVHNQMARYYNSGDYKKALEVVHQGLTNLPESKKLQKDLLLIQDVLKIQE